AAESLQRTATNESDCARRAQRYLIAVRSVPSIGTAFPPTFAGSLPSSFQPQSADAIVDYLSRQDGVEILERIKPPGVDPCASNGGFVQEIVVARIAEDRARSLRAATNPNVIVERDGVLYTFGGVAIPIRARIGASTLLPLSLVVREISVRVV